jgi:hypothetical protein
MCFWLLMSLVYLSLFKSCGTARQPMIVPSISLCFSGVLSLIQLMEVRNLVADNDDKEVWT